MRKNNILTLLIFNILIGGIVMPLKAEPSSRREHHLDSFFHEPSVIEIVPGESNDTVEIVSPKKDIVRVCQKYMPDIVAKEPPEQRLKWLNRCVYTLTNP